PESTPPPPEAMMAATMGVPMGRQATGLTGMCATLIDNRTYHRRGAVWEAAFNAGRISAPVAAIKGKPISKARISRKTADRTICGSPPRDPKKPKARAKPDARGRYHRRDLPPPPIREADFKDHQFGDMFRMADR